MTSRRWFWFGHAVGIAIIAAAVNGLLGERLGRPASVARFFFGGLVAHDALVAPAVFAVALVGSRLLPARSWLAVRAGLFATAVLVAFSWPFLRGYGRRDVNPSILPRDHARGLLLALAAVWLTVAAVMAVTTRRAQRANDSTSARMSSP